MSDMPRSRQGITTTYSGEHGHIDRIRVVKVKPTRMSERDFLRRVMSVEAVLPRPIVRTGIV